MVLVRKKEGLVVKPFSFSGLESELVGKKRKS
jgi:hypothetical protein